MHERSGNDWHKIESNQTPPRCEAFPSLHQTLMLCLEGIPVLSILFGVGLVDFFLVLGQDGSSVDLLSCRCKALKDM